MKKTFEILKTETLLDDFLTINAYQVKHDLFAGGKSPELRRLRLEKEKAVSVLLYDPVLQKVVMVDQFRIGALEETQSWLLENPAGYVEANETAETVAVREVLEETGCELQELIKICEFMVSPGISNERIILFCGKVDASSADGIHGLKEEGEDIKVEVLSLEEASRELYDGRINSTSTIMSMQWLLLNKREVDRKWLEG